MKKRLRNSKDTAKVVRVDSSSPDPIGIRTAAQILRQEGILVYPTSGLYGLGADAFCAEAIRRVFAIKRRPAHQPLLVLLSGNRDMDRVVRTIPGYAEVLLAMWPGGVTVIFEAGKWMPACLTGGTGKIGVRMPAHPVAKALVDQFGGPMDLNPEINRQVDMVLDAGTLAGGPGSTIVDVTCWPVRVVREGAVPRQTIDDLLNKG